MNNSQVLENLTLAKVKIVKVFTKLTLSTIGNKIRGKNLPLSLQ